jgi:hypothetical protein
MEKKKKKKKSLSGHATRVEGLHVAELLVELRRELRHDRRLELELVGHVLRDTAEVLHALCNVLELPLNLAVLLLDLPQPALDVDSLVARGEMRGGLRGQPNRQLRVVARKRLELVVEHVADNLKKRRRRKKREKKKKKKKKRSDSQKMVARRRNIDPPFESMTMCVCVCLFVFVCVCVCECVLGTAPILSKITPNVEYQKSDKEKKKKKKKKPMHGPRRRRHRRGGP